MQLPNIKKTVLSAIAVLICMQSLMSQVTQPGGVERYIVRKESVTDPATIPGLTNAEKTRTVSYVDGYGRPIQSIVTAGSPNGKDMVSFNKYDEFGRQPKQYLPYEATTSTGAYVDMSSISTAQSTFYDPAYAAAKKIAVDNGPYYAEQSFESSPLQRVLKTGGIGDGFQLNQHYKQLSYSTGLASESILVWTAGSSSASSSSTYGNYELSITQVEDEAGVKSKVYKDKFGRLVLKRQDAPSSGTYDTYYVYDIAGNIVYIIPPKAIAKMVGLGYNTSNTPELIYQFWYDNKNRVSKKKVPGAKEVYIVYDPLNRVVLTQDGAMRYNNGTKWAYIKYDNANRVVIQGIYTHGSSLSQESMQSHVDGQSCYATNSTTYYEKRETGSSGYSNQCFPTSNTEERQYFYFDDYDFDYNGTADYSKQDQGLTNEAVATSLTYGLATGSKRKILGTSTWLMDVVFYDKYYHSIQVRSNNQVKTNVTDHTTNVVNFAGQAVEAKQVKTIGDPNGITNTLEITVSTKYEYDDMGRLTKVKQTNPGQSELTVAKYEYNPLGQLVDKKLHSTNGTNYLQSVDMRYNIRGQLTSINNSTLTNDGVINDESNDVFGMEILYDKLDNNLSNAQYYTGMISAVKWKAASPANTDERSYKYSYDNLYRLTGATYQAKTASSCTKDQNGFNETLSYDENGNIKTLLRKSVISGTVTTIDDLTYSYRNSDYNNQLENISDAVTTNATGYGYRNFTNTNSTTPYDYDDNGNLKTDLKKGTTITYNELNKPTLIQISSTKKVEYRYDAAGTRISKYVYNNSSTVTKSIEYIGGYVIENDILSYYSMAEGRVRNEGGGFGLVMKMEYFITDQQGNTRVSFEDNNGTVALIQENSYYAFGMQMAGGYIPATNPNKKLYNAGSEWQDDIEGLADYYSTFFREYDAIIGRFNGVDPMSESFESWTTYHYSYNNPVNFNDPMGDMAKAEFENAIAALLANEGGTYHSSTGIFEFGQGAEVITAVAESIMGMSFTEFVEETGVGGSEGQDRFINTSKRKFEILNASSFGSMNLKNISYVGRNRLQFESDIMKIAKVGDGAMILAMIETSAHSTEVRDAPDYPSRFTWVIGNKVIVQYAGGSDYTGPFGLDDPSYVVLAHELFHGLDKRSAHWGETNYYWHYDRTDPMFYQPELSGKMGYKNPKMPMQITTDANAAYMELRAVKFENAIRSFYKLQQRVHYNGVYLSNYYSKMNYKTGP